MEQTLTATLAEQTGWPDALNDVFARHITCEYASLSARGGPIALPVTPYLGRDGHTLDVSTGLTYPSKAERARRNPRVALLFSNPTGSGLHNPPAILVQGFAAVRDADLQANLDRYLRESLVKLPDAYGGLPGWLMRRMAWYFARIWIEVTPARILWWPGGRFDLPPQRWEAPADTVFPQSDPAPAGKPPLTWKEAPADWRAGLDRALSQLGDPVLTTVDQGGFPFPLRVRARRAEDGASVALPTGCPAPLEGPACLTFHWHPEVFSGQQQVLAFVGELRAEPGGYRLRVERQLGETQPARSKLGALISLIGDARRLTPRLVVEARRRGQPVPSVRVPAHTHQE